MTNNSPHWLDIIGVTEAGVEALPAHLLKLLYGAKTIIGPARHLSGLPAIADQQHILWQAPLAKMREQVENFRHTQTIILATGDPNWFGIAATLARTLNPDELAIHPSPSAFQLAAAKMFWPLQNIATLSLHGRAVENLHPHILPANRILALTANATTLTEVAALLVARGYGKSMLNVMENLGGSNERCVSFPAHDAQLHTIGDFFTLAIDCVADPDAPLLPTIPGLPDDAFINDGQLTKRQVRAATLAALAPTPNALLWDVGAGSGSVGIEWMRAAPNAKAICFESDTNRAATITRNAQALGVPGLKTIIGSAPQNFNQHPAPDAIFIGGAVADENLFTSCWDALLPGGRLVANGVTMAAQTALVSRHSRLGGDLCTIAVASMSTIGTQPILKPALPVMQWSIRKPGS